MDLAQAENMEKDEVKLPAWLADFHDIFKPQGCDELPPLHPGLDY